MDGGTRGCNAGSKETCAKLRGRPGWGALPMVLLLAGALDKEPVP